jgi:hypothetical protein
MRQFLKSLFGRKTSPIRNSPAPRHAAQLGVQSLEAREVPAFLSGGVLFIEGTGGGDVVKVASANSATVRVTENGNTQYFSRSGITQGVVQFNGNAGNDYFENTDSALRVVANGGSGSDQIHGGALDDDLRGGSGDDYVVGGLGNDLLRGDGDKDQLFGGHGYDRLFGGSHDDHLFGGSHDDYLDGGTGKDLLDGGSGRDGLLGGVDAETDAITGGTGQDRFLDMTVSNLGSNDAYPDVAGEDAVIFFRNAQAQTVTLGSGIGAVDYTAGFWSSSQIESVDRGLYTLQQETGNTRLLKTSGGGALGLYKAGNTSDSAASTVGGWTSGNGAITITNYGAAANSSIGLTADQNIQRVTIHEIAHNWDNESPFYSDWLELSGWQAHHPRLQLYPPTGKVKSGDGNWWHNSTAQFARDYGKTNPFEDFATSWEAFFGFNGVQVDEKMDHIQGFMNYIDNLD